MARVYTIHHPYQETSLMVPRAEVGQGLLSSLKGFALRTKGPIWLPRERDVTVGPWHKHRLFQHSDIRSILPEKGVGISISVASTDRNSQSQR